MQDQHYHQYMLQLQQQQHLQVKCNFTNDSNEIKHEEVILEGDDARTILNPESVSRIINDGNSDSDDSECKLSRNY